MPSTKRQRTNRDSSASSRADSDHSSSSSARPCKSARKDGDDNQENNSATQSRSTSPPVDYVDPVPHRGCGGGFSPGESDQKAPYEYICMHRPLFDVISENWRLASEGKAEHLEQHEIFTKMYRPGYIEENKNRIWGSAPAEHKDHKWVIMVSAWKNFDGFCRGAKYCDPDNFNMYIHNDWKGYGVQEIADHAMLDFDKAFQKKNGPDLDEMWAILSAIGLWTNVEDVSELIHTDDADKCCELIGLLGCALLTTLSALERAGELTPHSRFLDLALVIGHYLELSHDLPNYGIEGACVSWRREAVKFFKKANLDPGKGLFDTANRLKQLENAPNYDFVDPDDKTQDESDKELLHHEQGTEDDPWAWKATMGKYKKSHMATTGRYQHDITKLTRAQRAAACFDGRDPLANVAVKDLRNNLLDMI